MENKNITFDVESEKTLDKKLSREIKRLGGWSIKLLTNHFTGLPDRLCLFPAGRICFVELKTTNQKLRKIQGATILKLVKLGFHVEVIDSSNKIEKFIKKYETE